jgi:hypothetical protein
LIKVDCRVFRCIPVPAKRATGTGTGYQYNKQPR